MSQAERESRYRGTGADMELDDDPSIRRRGRGFGAQASGQDADGVKTGDFERLPAMDTASDVDIHAARSMEGWVIMVTNVHDEATEDDVMDLFLDFGKVRDLHLNLDRRTGYVKGYALLQYETQQEARDAIEACQKGLTLLEQPLEADYAFVQPPKHSLSARSTRRAPRRERSLSPMRS